MRKMPLNLNFVLCFGFFCLGEGCSDISGLGLSSGFIKNYQITASSYVQHDSNNNNPSQARLGIRNSWCGNYFGQASIIDEWLQVDFEKPVIIKAVATQGDPNDVTNFVKSFSLEVSDDGKTFHPMNDTAGTKKVFHGNTDNNGIKFNWISNHVTTRYVRFRAAQIKRANDGSVCVRLEFYGCQAGTDFRDGKYLYPVGIRNKQIQDGSFSASNQQNGKDAKFARLNDAKSWCASSASNQWLQVDLGNVYTITAITTQGSGDKNSPEFVTSYAVAYSTSSPSSLSNLEDFPGRAVVFKATPDTSQEPIMNVMPNTINARYLRIMPWSKGSKSTMYCMRIEIYGYRSDCFEDISSRLGYTITSSTLKSGTVRNAYINSKNSWCANVNDQSQFIKISFGNAMKVSGIAIQGNAQGSDWVKTFKVKYKAPCGVETEITTVFDGGSDSSTVTIHWFTSIIKTEYLIISPQTWNNNICLRFQIIGCEAYVKRIPLGMANGYIPKSRLGAFSSDDANSGPEQARLGVNTRWSGGNPGSGFPNDYHQVDFGRVVMLTGIATQGDPGSATDFVKKFYLKVGNSSSSFTEVKDCNANRKEFDGNTNNNGIKYNYFPDPIVTQYVRFHATQLQKSDGTEKVRLRLEYYGMELHGQQAGTKALYPLGMENSIIQDSQLSTNNVGCCPVAEGRLRHVFGWCAGSTNDKWMQITLQKAMTVTAVATQGHGGGGSKDRTYQYYVSYSTDSGTTWSIVKDSSNANKLFTGNKYTQRDPVMDYISFPVKTRYIRINPQTLGTAPNAASTFCMRVELYGYDAECSDDLTKSDDTMITASTYNQNNYPSMAHVNSPVSWCADSADASPYLLIDLGSPKKITGFGVQGDSNGDNWAKQTKISYGNEQCCLTELPKVFTANSDRNRAVYNWFSTEIIAQFVKIKVHDKNGNACMRIRILGCDGGIRRAALGLTNGLIRNTELSASSAKSNSVDDQSSQARLKITSSWCAASKLQSEWLQVDFGRTVSLTGIATQGDPHSSPADYVGQFYLKRSNDGSSFSDVQYIGGRLLFIGNTDKTNINYNWFNSVLKTRYVRLRPLVITGNRICVRMEYYGTGRNTALANSKDLYPLGMENEAIPDAKITASTQLTNDQSFKGRLNAFGWCPMTSDASPYLQIDLGAPLLVVAIATQGHAYNPSVDRASEYNMKFSKDGSSTFSDVNKRDSTKQVFVGNVEANNDPVLSFLEIPVKAQVIRVVPTAKGTSARNWCMRVELYGHHSECSDDITVLKDTRLSASSSKSGKSPYAATIDSAHGWCANTSATTEYILIDLGEARRITGVGIQGDSENDNWATKFKISIGNCLNLITEMTQEYIANKNRFDVTRHWFPSYIYARYIKFRATAINGAGPVCMRVQVLGCKENLPKTDFSRAPLGMGNGFIADAQITGTSKYTEPGKDLFIWSWDNARLKLTGNRWCSKQPLNYADYVEVDFKEVVTLTGVATQGDDNYHGNYVKKYYLQVSYDGTTFTDVSNKSCTREVLTGNTDHTGIVYNWLSNPTKARYVRFRASDVAGTHICARLEFYGSSSSKAGSKALYTLGMESGAITNSQLTSSTAKPSDPPSEGRFRFPNSGWCPTSADADPWLQIDFRQPMVITAITTQGHGAKGASGRTSSYNLKYKKTSSSSLEYAKDKSNGNMVFTGNNKFQSVPVLNLLPVPVTGQIVRIYPTAAGAGATDKCIRAELYGYHPVCYDDLTIVSGLSASSSSQTVRDALVHSKSTWCADTSDTNKYIMVDLRSPKMVTGIGIQGDSNSNQWVKTFKLSHSRTNGDFTELSKVFTGNADRNSVVRNWLLPPLFTRYLKIKVDTLESKACMRIQVLGCSKAYDILSKINSVVVNMRKVEIHWSIVSKVSSTFTLQYRKTEESSWKEDTATSGNTTTLTSLEKYKNYIVRLKSANGILMLKNYVFGGSYSETSTFLVKKDPGIVPKSVTPSNVGSRTFTVGWTLATQTEKDDWDIKGVQIQYKCLNDPNSADCISSTRIDHNITDLAVNSYNPPNLKPWTNYTVKLQFYNPVGRGLFSTPITIVTKEEAPSDAPVIQSSSIHERNIDITMTGYPKEKANGKLLGYRVSVRCIQTSVTRDCSSTDWKNKTVFDTSKLTISVNGLISWTKYEILISVYNAAGASPGGRLSKTTSEIAPSKAPTALSAEVKSSSTIDITWTQLKKNDTNGVITKYIAEVVRLDNSQTQALDAISNLGSITASGLKAYANYSIKVAAVNKIGTGPFSATIIKETMEAVPGAAPTVGNIMASKFFAEIQITNINKEQENGVILGYKLEYTCVNDQLYRLCSNIASKQVTITGKATGSVKLSSLMSWTKYKVKILVFNKAGDGPYSPEKDFFTKQEVPRLPPRNIILLTTGSRSLLLSWDHLSKNDTNGIIINYSVCTQQQGASTPICVNVSATDNRYTANGLKPYSNYTVTIAAINSAGFGPYNSGITKQTNEEAPAAAPTIQAFSTGKFDATVTIMNINKNDANGKLLGYFVGYECVNNGANSRDCPVNSKKNVTKHGYPKSTISVLNLMSWTKYKITVQVFNSAGGSQKSTAMEELTKEDNPSTAPPSIIVGNTGSRVVTVSWQSVPKNNTNGPIIGYEVKLEYFRRGTHTVKVTATTDLNVDIGNLFPYTIYNVTVRAKNKVGFGPYSEMKSIRTDEDAPSVPTITNTIPQGTTSIEVRWSRPIDPNGMIRHYELKYCLQPTNCSQIRMPGNKTDGIVEKLQTHVNYTFQIRAFTVKYGNWSNNVTEKTIEGIPTKPLSLKIESYEKSLTLTWTEPAKPKGVILYYKVDGTGKKPYNSSFTQIISRTYTCVMIQNSFTKECSTLYSVVDLVPGTDYEFEIAAATSKGLGPRSSKASGSTKVAAAPKPKMQIFTSKEIGTELNLTINSVTNYYGPIINYQIIIQMMQSNSEKPMTNFPVLLQKSDALAQKLKYFLAKTVTPDKMPYLMSFKPGVSLVDALSLELETPGNYLMHFRAVSKRAGAFKDPEVYGNITTYKLERKQMKTLPKPKDKDVGATTIKLDLTITLPKGFVPTFYYVIAVKVIPGKQFKDSASYKPEDLNKYDASNKGKPYIAAVLSKAEYDAMSEKVFEIGTGKSTTFTSARRRRMARAVTENYQNAPLDADSAYRAFVMALASKTSYFATPWIPEVRTKSPPPNPPEPVGPPTGAIVGGIVAAILIFASVIVFVYFKRRRRDNTNGTDYFDKIEEQEMKPKVRDVPPRMAHYSNQTTDVDGLPTEPTSLEVTKSPMYPPFPAKDIVQVVNRKSAQDDAGFDEEFKNLPKGQLFAWTIGKDLSMKPRNRFANIVPYDYNRLKLQTSQDDCDYINASYVVDYFGQRRYIAAQAPVPATIPDFWTMIWQQQITAIVMLTRCVEGNKRKSEEYWPTEGTEEYGNMSVSFMFAEEFPEYVMSTFELKRGNATRTCRHFHYLTWPDHGVPEYPTAILSFRRRLRQFISWEKQGKNPIIVHCSAGVGRTGTFIAIDTLIPLIHKSRIIDAFGYVQLLRLQRPEMVQRLAQYKFIYECLLEAAVCGVTEISAQEYRQRYNNLSNVDAKTGKDGFAREFTSLSFVGIDIPDDDFSAARQASNLHKNRDQTVLPRNTQRVFLPAVDFSDGCNYINATFVDGSHKDQFIATQAPVEKTVGDFWRMVIERGTVAIVSLVEINETIPKHWPEYGEAQYDNGNITVELTSSKNIENDVVHYVFSATDKLFNRSLSEIHYYNFNQWRDHKIPANVTSLVKVVSEVESAQRTSNGSPIVVHCGNGAGRTGTFIAAYIILERLKAEQMVDVFQTVRRIRKTRPQFVENPEQYKLLYEAVGVYLEQFSTYSNF